MNYQSIETSILNVLNQNAQHLLEGAALNSPRSIGDAVQEFMSSKGLSAALQSLTIDIKSDFTRRSMEDIAFEDKNGNYFAVDVKTHNEGTDFNMPNLISVRRLAEFYKNDNNTFCILLVAYKIENGIINYHKCYFRPIESFKWNCLTIGALGWGQIQIANANKIYIDTQQDRKTWMLTLCDLLQQFYDTEIGKIEVRKTWFSEMSKYWQNK